jgi:transposase
MRYGSISDTLLSWIGVTCPGCKELQVLVKDEVPGLRHQCVAHMLRRARDLLSVARVGDVHFPAQVIALFTDAVHWRNESARVILTPDQLEKQREAFDDCLIAMLPRPRSVPTHAAFAKHLWNHIHEWFYDRDTKVEATNLKTAQAICSAVVEHKIWVCNPILLRTKTHGILISIFETRHRRIHSTVAYVSRTLHYARLPLRNAHN